MVAFSFRNFEVARWPAANQKFGLGDLDEIADLTGPLERVDSLDPNSERAGIAGLVVETYRHNAAPNPETIRQPKNNLRKVEAGHEPYILSRYVVALVVRVDQIDSHRRRRLALGQLNAGNEENDSRIRIGGLRERVRRVHHLKWIPQKQHRVQSRCLFGVGTGSVQ
jgi:hypothetical protein